MCRSDRPEHSAECIKARIGNDNSTLYGENRNNTSRATLDSLLSQGSLWSPGVLKANIPLPGAFSNNAINAF